MYAKDINPYNTKKKATLANSSSKENNHQGPNIHHLHPENADETSSFKQPSLPTTPRELLRWHLPVTTQQLDKLQQEQEKKQQDDHSSLHNDCLTNAVPSKDVPRDLPWNRRLLSTSVPPSAEIVTVREFIARMTPEQDDTNDELETQPSMDDNGGNGRISDNKNSKATSVNDSVDCNDSDTIGPGGGQFRLIGKLLHKAVHSEHFVSLVLQDPMLWKLPRRQRQQERSVTTTRRSHPGRLATTPAKSSSLYKKKRLVYQGRKRARTSLTSRSSPDQKASVSPLEQALQEPYTIWVHLRHVSLPPFTTVGDLVMVLGAGSSVTMVEAASLAGSPPPTNRNGKMGLLEARIVVRAVGTDMTLYERALELRREFLQQQQQERGVAASR